MQNDINDIDQNRRGPKNGKIIAGFILLVIGAVLLTEQISGLFFPSWVFGFPMWLLVIGIYIGAKHNFKKPSALIMMTIGGIWLLNDAFPGYNLSNLAWPAVIILVGILMILNRNQQWNPNRFKGGRKHRWSESQKWEENQKYAWDKKVNPDNPAEPIAEEPVDTSYTSEPNTGYGRTYKGYPIEDYLDATSIFGSANKTIFTKTFRGGEIVNIFGGAEIDFTQSDISGQVVIDVTQIFGGIKLLVPPHWHVTSDTVSLFAGFDDKRKQKTLTGDKVLMITGTSIFAGIEIRSY